MGLAVSNILYEFVDAFKFKFLSFNFCILTFTAASPFRLTNLCLMLTHVNSVIQISQPIFYMFCP